MFSDGCFHGKDFADIFGAHSVSVSRLFKDVLYLLCECLKFLIIWLEREAIRKTLPVAFWEECPSCTCIIDCFEIFIEKPSDHLACCQTYSSYKHHNTAKYLIAITPCI